MISCHWLHHARRSRHRLLALSTALAVASPPLTADAQGAPGTIVGRVVQEGNQPINAAQASLVGLRIGAITNDQGTFRILNVPPGSYQLRVAQLGYKPV